MHLVWIAVFGALGSLARYGVGVAAKTWLGAGFPYGTLLVNTVGSFVLAFVTVWALEGRVSENVCFAIGVGFCGAFTTFSTFELDVQQLIAGGRVLEAFGYITSSLLLGFGGVLFGQWLARTP